MTTQTNKAMIGGVQATQPQTMASEPVSIFFSYSRKDEALMREMESHLEPLRLSRLIESWHDGCITPGEEWEPQIKENLQKAQIILLLISVNFISSKYCNAVELTQAMKRHKSGEALVIPLILKPCMWHPIPVGEMTLGELQALPKDAKPVTSWKDPDEAYTNIAQGLYEKILQLQQEREAEAERQRQEAEAALRRQREQEAAERQRREAEAQHQREEAERQQKRDDYYNGGIYHLNQGNLDKAIADLTQAKQLGHPQAAQKLTEAEQLKQATEVAVGCIREAMHHLQDNPHTTKNLFTLPQKPMHTRKLPIRGRLHQPMLHRVVMNIFATIQEIPLPPNAMLPIAPLP
jgi:tetratricopeptide (TPR) repeat protein